MRTILPPVLIITVRGNTEYQAGINDAGADGVKEVEEEQASGDVGILERANRAHTRFRLLGRSICPFQHFLVGNRTTR